MVPENNMCGVRLAAVESGVVSGSGRCGGVRVAAVVVGVVSCVVSVSDRCGIRE